MVNYETGVATSPSDLLAKFLAFLATCGWQSGTPISGDAVIWNDATGTIYAGIDATTTEWHRRGCTGFDSGLAWDAQPGAAAYTDICNFGAGPFTAYHFFVGDEDANEYAHMAVEVTAGVFRHWVLGSLVKAGSYTGGTYCDSVFRDSTSNPALINNAEWRGHRHIGDTVNLDREHAHIWVDYDGKASPNWQRVRVATNALNDDDACLGSGRSTGIMAAGWIAQDQAWNLRTPMFPIMYFARRASSLMSPIGRIPNTRFVSMRNFQPSEVVTYGSEDWMIFPMFARYETTPAAGTPSSGLYGIAHKRS